MSSFNNSKMSRGKTALSYPCAGDGHLVAAARSSRAPERLVGASLGHMVLLSGARDIVEKAMVRTPNTFEIHLPKKHGGVVIIAVFL